MSNCILGLLTDKQLQKKYNVNNEQTLHAKSRENRADLVDWNAKPLYYFEVFRYSDKSRQIHCLMEDATILIFARDNGKLITMLLAKPVKVDMYLKKITKDRNESLTIRKLYKYAKLNSKSGASNVDADCKFNEEELERYLYRKNTISKIK